MATTSKRVSVKKISEAGWLAAVLQEDLQLQVCRYNVRQGSWHSQHVHPGQHFITFVEQGPLCIDVADESLQLDGGELLWIQPGVRRVVRGAIAADRVVRHINIRFTLQRRQSFLACSGTYTHLPAAQGLRGLIDDLLEYREDPGVFADLQLRQIILGLCIRIVRTGQREVEGPSLDARQRYELQRYIADHMQEAIGPQDLAAVSNLSLDYFTRCFRRSYGMPPRRYLLEERMRVAAMHLVDGRDSVQEIALQVGMDDCNYFCRQFKKVIGMTPTQFRKRGLLPEQLH